MATDKKLHGEYRKTQSGMNTGLTYTQWLEEKLIQSNKDANEFIIDIANLLKMDTDSVGFDDIQFSIDDFKDAIERLKTDR